MAAGSQAEAQQTADAREAGGRAVRAPGSPGVEWLVEARGCRPEALRSEGALRALFDSVVADLGLRPVASPVFHRFPPPGGLTGVLLLSESHLTCHTFPETGYAALNLYCCRPRPRWDFAAGCREHLGATETGVVEIPRGGLEPAR